MTSYIYTGLDRRETCKAETTGLGEHPIRLVANRIHRPVATESTTSVRAYGVPMTTNQRFAVLRERPHHHAKMRPRRVNPVTIAAPAPGQLFRETRARPAQERQYPPVEPHGRCPSDPVVQPPPARLRSSQSRWQHRASDCCVAKQLIVARLAIALQGHDRAKLVNHIDEICLSGDNDVDVFVCSRRFI